MYIYVADGSHFDVRRCDLMHSGSDEPGPSATDEWINVRGGPNSGVAAGPNVPADVPADEAVDECHQAGPSAAGEAAAGPSNSAPSKVTPMPWAPPGAMRPDERFYVVIHGLDVGIFDSW